MFFTISAIDHAAADRFQIKEENGNLCWDTHGATAFLGSVQLGICNEQNLNQVTFKNYCCKHHEIKGEMLWIHPRKLDFYCIRFDVLSSVCFDVLPLHACC